MEKFTIGLLLGAVGGALLAANSCKMRTLVRKGQEEVKQRLDEMMDEKLKDIENGKGIFSSQSSEKSGEGEQSKGDMEKTEKKSRGKEFSPSGRIFSAMRKAIFRNA